MTGTALLVRLVLRRDRVLLPLWILLVTAFLAGTAASFAAAYPTAAAQQEFVATVAANPALAALIGPVLGPGVGGLTAWRIGTAGSLIVGVIAILAVVRHTRAGEGDGTQELARAAVIGRGAHLAAALAVVGAGMLLMAGLITAALAAQGVPAAGALALALSLAGVGWVFAGVAAIAQEVCSTARAATAVSLGVLALALVLRMVEHWVVWLTPVGWMQQVLPFAGPRWWVLALMAAAAAALAGTAFALRARRDLGAGLLADRPGPAHAGPALAGVLGLAWRQNRGTLLSVVAGYGLLGLVMGSAADGAAQAGPQLGPFLARLGLADGGDALVVLLIYVFAEVLAAVAIVLALRPRTDETGGLAGVLLATPVGRIRWIGSQLVIVLAGTTVAMLVLGLTTGLAHGAVGLAVGSALAKVPAVWVLAAVAALLVGVVPRAAAAGAWAAFVLVLGLELAWEFGRIGDALFAISPFSWVYPLAGHSALPAMLGLTAVAAVLGGAGLVAVRRRDIG